ncbi:hypothetical protein Patl1_27952 [Pistacia atlantica]|uniref:Uncharacterized protein n=1 Tax=Pistacia atlantica TaxID=434234 RepID=A0ACC1BFI5_9ROSI|nr:hypothetical protein Patl1_27952 [Pistacia atlantica]
MLLKIWKRVMITFALSFTTEFCYLRVETLIVQPLFHDPLIDALLILLQLKDLSGIKAMMKSKNLIKGRIGVAVFKGLAIGFCHGVIDYRIDKRFSGSDNGFNWRNGVGIGIGIPCLILLHSMVSLLDFVVDTVIYFSCKSHEVTMRVLTTQSHQINFKSIWWSVLDPLME